MFKTKPVENPKPVRCSRSLKINRKVEPTKEPNILVKEYVQEFDKTFKYAPFRAVAYYFILLAITALLLFTAMVLMEFDFSFLGNNFLLCVILCAIMSVTYECIVLFKHVKHLSDILNQDKDAITYLLIAEYGINNAKSKNALICFRTIYVMALCANNRRYDALRFISKFKDDKRLNQAYIALRLNIASDENEFNYFYKKLKKGKSFNLPYLYKNKKYNELIMYINNTMKNKTNYEIVLCNLYLAKAYYKLGEYKRAVIHSSACLAESKKIPSIYYKAKSIYNESYKRV